MVVKATEAFSNRLEDVSKSGRFTQCDVLCDIDLPCSCRLR